MTYLDLRVATTIEMNISERIQPRQEKKLNQGIYLAKRR